MLTVDDPDVGVDELLRRVRQEVERRRLQARMHKSAVPSLADDQAAASWQAVNEAIDAAGVSSTVGERLPPMSQMRGLRRRLAVPVARVILRAAQLVTRDQSAFNRLVLDLLRMLTDTVHDRLTAASGKLDTLTEGLAQAISQSRAVPELLDAGARTAAEVRALRERIAGFEDAAARLEAAIAELVRRLDDTRTAELASKSEAERQRAEHARTVAALERRIAGLLEGVQRRPAPGAPAQVTAVAGDALAQLSDAFYVSFEDRFRGSSADVKQRTRVYLPLITDAGAGTADRPVLDVGCGRGEWLELLGENGLVGHGIDRNQTMVAESRARGLEVTEADVLEHLRSLPAASLGAVTGMHVLEHVDFSTLVAILDECTRVLRPGGVAIFETPNPKNLVVGACQFYLDPTHRTPLHPDAMVFVAESRGLSRVHVLPLHPVEHSRLPETDSPIAKLLNEYLFGPQDFALVGYRA